MNGKGPIEFKYKGNFYGLPLSESTFYILPFVIRPSQSMISYDKTVANFYNVEECSKEFLVEKMRRKHEFYLFEKKRAGREKESTW